MKRWFVTMGDFSSAVGTLLEVVWSGGDTLEMHERLRFEPPQGRALVSKGLTGARLHQGSLWVCCFNMVIQVDVSSWCGTPWLMRDDLNDLHDLHIISDAKGHMTRCMIANTGHDRIDVFDAEKNLINRIELAPRYPDAYSEDSDPYFAGQAAELPAYMQKRVDWVHPNAIYQLNDTILVSCLLDRGFRLIERGVTRHIDAEGCSHDIAVSGDHVWFTTTDGRVWSFDLYGDPAFRPILRIDTWRETGLGGWCRGLAVDEDVVLVGLTRLTHMPRDRWTERPFEGTTTALLLFEKSRGKLIAKQELGHLGSHPKLFAIIAGGDA